MAAVHDKTILEGSSKKIKNSNIEKNRKISIEVIKLQCLLSWVQNCFLLGLILARSCLHLCFPETFRRDESISGHLVSSPSFARRHHANDRLDIRWHMIQSSLLKISAIWNRFLDTKFEKMWWLVMYTQNRIVIPYLVRILVLSFFIDIHSFRFEVVGGGRRWSEVVRGGRS